GEGELRLADTDAVPVDQARPALLLSVDGQVGRLVDGLDLEIPAGEDDLSVVGQHGGVHEDDVIPEGPADGGHRLVNRVELRRAAGGEESDGRHAWVRPGGESGQVLGILDRDLPRSPTPNRPSPQGPPNAGDFARAAVAA